jgi:hypothetical protein
MLLLVLPLPLPLPCPCFRCSHHTGFAIVFALEGIHGFILGQRLSRLSLLGAGQGGQQCCCSPCCTVQYIPPLCCCVQEPLLPLLLSRLVVATAVW